MSEMDFLGPIIKAARDSQTHDPSDFFGTDGLSCTAGNAGLKEKMLLIGDDELKVPVMCKCREEKGPGRGGGEKAERCDG